MVKYWPTVLGLLAALAAVAFGLHSASDQPTQWLLAARYTARIGFFLLILTYSASSLVRLWPTDLTRSILRQRKYWGLGFAASHTVHLYALTKAVLLSSTPPSLATLIGGGFGYVVLYAMALTSFPWAYKALGKWWKRLHSFGIHYLWFVFAFSYFGRIFRPGYETTGIVFGSIALAALGLRIAAALKSRAKRAA